MKRSLLIYLLPVLALLILPLLTACGGSASGSAIDDIREAEDATALGDMEVAKSVASRVLSSKNLSDMPASQLARLSLVYMQIADSTDRESSIAQATDLYRKAFAENPDSAAAYYADVHPDMYPYVAMLKALVGRIDNPYKPEADSIDEDAHMHLPEPTDSITSAMQP